MGQKIHKLCPFCWGNQYAYRTYSGLLHHVMNSHICDLKGRTVYPYLQKAEALLVETLSGITIEKVDGWDEVQDFLSDYVKGYPNPSKKSTRLWKYVLD